MLIKILEEAPTEWNENGESIQEIKYKTYMLREYCDAELLMRTIHNLKNRYLFTTGIKPKYLILGVQAYESLSATNYKMLKTYLSDKALDLEIVLDYKDVLNVEVRGNASEDFISCIKNNRKVEIRRARGNEQNSEDFKSLKNKW